MSDVFAGWTPADHRDFVAYLCSEEGSLAARAAGVGGPGDFRDTVMLGLDASLNEDATALVACRVSDGHIELLACWQPDDSDTDPEAWQIVKDVVDAQLTGFAVQWKRPRGVDDNEKLADQNRDLRAEADRLQAEAAGDA